MTEDYWDKLDEAAMHDELAVHGRVRPPWEAYPQIPRGSIGWRMGPGEVHLNMWWAWWNRNDFSEADRVRYFTENRPAPSWIDWAGDAIWPAPAHSHQSYDEQCEAAVARMEEAGLGKRSDWLDTQWGRRGRVR